MATVEESVLRTITCMSHCAMVQPEMPILIRSSEKSYNVMVSADRYEEKKKAEWEQPEKAILSGEFAVFLVCARKFICLGIFLCTYV